MPTPTFLFLSILVFFVLAILYKILSEIRNELRASREATQEFNERLLHQNEQTENALKNIYTDIAMYLKSTPPAPAESTPEELYEEAKEAVIEFQVASASFLQKHFHIGYAKAAKLLDMLEERDVVGPSDGAKPREVLIDKEDLE